jgi:hypothetical protein
MEPEEEYEILELFFSWDRRTAEKKAHKALAKYRVGTKEIFRLSGTAACMLVRELV